MASEPRCADCPIRSFAASMDDDAINSIRMLPNDPDDRREVLALPNGERLLAALALERPERCQELRAALPKLWTRSKRMHPYALCAEVQLLSEIVMRREPEE